MVEDEQPLVALLRGYLEREGHETHEAFDGRSGLEVARRVEPDLVVLDWMLPGLGGLEVLRELRRFSDAYVIISPPAPRRWIRSWGSPRVRTTI